MDEQDYISIFYELVSTLNEVGFAWIVNDVNEAINEGKISTMKVETFKETLSDSGYEREIKNVSQAEFQSVTEYSPRERLLVLLEAIERTMVQTSTFEVEVTEFFEDEVTRPDISDRVPPSASVVLASEQLPVSESQYGFVKLEGYDAYERAQNAQRLLSLIEALRQEIGDDAS